MESTAALDTSPKTQREARQASPVRQRLVSLDVFRGMTVAGMLLVNDPGTWSAVYPPLEHAEWNGWTLTDLVFPFFLFIMGVALELSLASRREALSSGAARQPVMRHILYRSLILFALGVFLHLAPLFHIRTMRIMGVLQRIALCYFFAALLTLKTGLRTRIATVAVLLLGYWALMTLVPVPGYGAGHLDPEGNLAAYIDRALMNGHLWKPRWDPEGWLSTLPAIATTLLGGFAGRWLSSTAAASRKILGLVFAGVAGLAVGELWNIWFPINKNLWTSSYTVFTAGFACLLLALCYWLIEVQGWKRWGLPFQVFGANAIFAYVLSIILAKAGYLVKFTAGGQPATLQGYLYQHFFASLASPRMSSLLFAIAFVILCWLPAAVLYRKKMFLKI
jgi:predicted acyltransferase